MDQPLPPPRSSPPPRRGLPIAGVAFGVGLLAFLIGLALGAALLGGDDDGGSGTSAGVTGGAADAAAACLLLAGVPEDVDLFDADFGLDRPLSFRLTAASEAAQAASRADAAYTQFGELGEAMRRGLISFDIDRLDQALTDLRGHCADSDD